ncbi:GNAT family N-acetyltransferase [uncultured Sphingomonas sp.]|uniref:GNAT family N-acetyltransferase n=1 Tax=uncultured Sphingomonas sp. TaxID=158754 RepID=UPI0035CC0564
MTTAVLPLRFQIGARTLLTIPRRLERVAWSLDGVLDDRSPPVPQLAADADGYLFTSIPEKLEAEIDRTGLTGFVRQRYMRHYTDLAAGHDAWMSGMSANARSSLKRKRKKLLQHPEGLAIRSFRTAAELAEFQLLARPLAALTYQERLLGSGLPDDDRFKRRTALLASEDSVRAWLMTLGGRPIAYLWCAAEGDTLRYDYVGHDPALSEWSPGTVLHAAALEELFAKARFKRFDFTEGEGQHKRQFATGGVPCVDLLLLRSTIANRATLGALRYFDGGLGVLKRIADRPGLSALAKRVRRA